MIIVESEFFTPTVSLPTRPEFESFRGQAVAIVVLNSNGEILLVQENESDEAFGRKAGHWNIVTETRECNERAKQTVARAFQEELGARYEDFVPISGSYRETNGEYAKGMGSYKMRCVCVVFQKDPSDICFRSDREINDYRWIHPNNLGQFDIEDGAKTLIGYYKNQEATKVFFAT